MFRFELVPLKECQEVALAFRNANRPLQRTHEYFSWRYLARPCAEAPVVAWAWHGESPAGAVTIAPHDFAIYGQMVRLGILGDVSIAPQHRGSGLGVSLLEFVAKRMMGIGMHCIVLPNAAAQKALRKARWEAVCKVDRYVRPILPVGSERAGVRISLARRALSRVVSAGLRTIDAAAAVVARDAVLAAEDGDQNELASLWRRTELANTCLSVRTPEYIRWRYLDHPLQRYDFLALRSPGELLGYAIVHLEGPTLVVDDYLLSGREFGTTFCLKLIDWARSRSLFDIQMRTSNTLHWGIPWRWLGFIPRNDAIEVMGSPGLASAIHLKDHRDWFLTAGDKDV